MWSEAPGAFDRKNRRDPAAQARLVPLALVVFADLANRIDQIFKRHARSRDTLACRRTTVVIEEKIEELPFPIQNDRKIAVSTGKIAILRARVERVARLQHHPKIENRLPTVDRNHRSDFRRGHRRVLKQSDRLGVIPPKERAIDVRPN